MGERVLPPVVLRLVRLALTTRLGTFWDNPPIAAWVVRRATFEQVCLPEDADIDTCEGRICLVSLLAGLLEGRPKQPLPLPSGELALLGLEQLAGWGHDPRDVLEDFWIITRCLCLALGKLLPSPGVSCLSFFHYE